MPRFVLHVIPKLVQSGPVRTPVSHLDRIGCAILVPDRSQIVQPIRGGIVTNLALLIWDVISMVIAADLPVIAIRIIAILVLIRMVTVTRKQRVYVVHVQCRLYQAKKAELKSSAVLLFLC